MRIADPTEAVAGLPGLHASVTVGERVPGHHDRSPVDVLYRKSVTVSCFGSNSHGSASAVGPDSRVATHFLGGFGARSNGELLGAVMRTGPGRTTGLDHHRTALPTTEVALSVYVA